MSIIHKKKDHHKIILDREGYMKTPHSGLHSIRNAKHYFHFRAGIQKKPKIKTTNVGKYRELVLPLYFGWEIVIRHRTDWREQVVGPFKNYWHYITVVAIFIISFSTIIFVYNSLLTQAATYNFVQTDWSGGITANNANHTSNRTGWDEYVSKDSNISVGTEIVLTEGTTTLIETSDTDFDAGATTTASVIGSGDSAGIYLEASEVNLYTDNTNFRSGCFDSSTNSLWVPDYTAAGVAKFSTDSGSYIATYSSPGISDCAFDSSTNSIWLTESTWDRVRKISAADGSLIDVYSVGQTNRGVTFDSSTNSIWVTNYDDDTVTKVAVSDGSVTGTYTVGNGPWGIEFDSSTNSVWVSNFLDDTVTKVAVSDGSVTGTYTVGNGPKGMTFDSSTNSIWSGNTLEGTVTKVAVSDGSVTGTYAVTGGAYDVSFDSSTNSVWVGGSNKYSKIKASDGTIIQYDATGLLYYIEFDINTNTIWLLNTTYDTITRVNPSTGAMFNTYAAGDDPRIVVSDSSTDSIWTASYLDDAVIKLSAADGSVTGTYSVGNGPRGVAFDSSTNSLWVTNSLDNTVSKVAAADGSVTGTYSVGNGPREVTFDSSTNSLWVTNYTDDTVTKLSAADGSVTGTYSVGNAPWGIVFETVSDSVWVTNYLDGTVTKLSAADGSVTGTYTIVAGPRGITFDSSTNSVWTANYSAGNIAKIAIADGSVTGTYSAPSTEAITFDSSTNSVWVTLTGTAKVKSFSVADGSANGGFYVGNSPFGVAFDSSTNSIWVTASTGDAITKIPLYSYLSSGTFISQILDTTANSGFDITSWTSSVPTNTTLTMKVRSDSSSDMSGATAWATCNTITSGVDISSNNCVTDTHRYVQYQASLSSSDSSVSSQLQDISIQYNSYSNGSLLGSVFNTEDAVNAMGAISWTESGTGDVQLQVRTAPDSSSSPDWTSGSGWCGPSNCAATTGDTDYAASYYTSSGSTFHSDQSSGANDQWYQYRLWLTSADGISTPTFSDVTISYVVNAPPQFENTITASQGSDGLVTIDYSIRDTDTTSGSATPGYITPSFQYSSNGGSDWYSITTGLSANATSTKAVDESSYTAYQATWTAREQNIGIYSTQTQIRVILDDGEAANNTTSSDTVNFTMDAKVPTAGATPIYVVATTTPASLFLSASDDTSLQMCLTLDNTESNCITYNTTSTLALATDPDTAYVIFKDSKSNTTAANAVTPETPSNMIIRDLSNVLNVPVYRLFVSWAVVAVPGPGFTNYEVWHSTDGTSYSLLSTITDRTVNYYLHDDLSADSTHYYKIYTTDSDGNTSYFSSAVSDVANGQGGTDASPPSISSVATSTVGTQNVTFTWTTDELSDSTVGYSTTAANFDTEVGVASMVTSHSVILTGLSPGTTYYAQVKSIDPDSNTATDNDGGDGYTFTTLSGPAISNTSASTVQNTSATITWNTDIAADSTVYYSTNSDMSGSMSTTDSDSVTEHSISISDLTVGTKYYFYVTSGVATDNNGGDYYTLNTTSDSIAPVITGVTNSIITDDDAVITWTTNEGATSQISYGLVSETYTTSTAATSVYNTSHSVTLTPLVNNTLYYYRVVSVDSAGNTSTSTTEATFTTLEQLTEESEVLIREDAAEAVGYSAGQEPASCGGGGGGGDSSPPIISDVSSELVSDEATISWFSNETAIAIVNYGIESTNENSATNPQTLVSPTRRPSVVINNLTPNITYKYKAVAIDSSGNVGYSEEGTFNSEDFALDIGTGEDGGEESFDNTIDQVAEYFQKLSTEVSISTLEGGAIRLIDNIASIIPPPIISGEPLLTISSNAATISWTTDDEANALVAYAREDYYLSNNDYEYTIGNSDLYLAGVHQINITGLEPETIYHYKIISKKPVGSTAQSKDFNFTTIAELAEIENYTTEIVSPEEVSFKWITTVPTDSNVRYTAYRDGVLDLDSTRLESNEVFTTIHNITAEDLEAGVLYQVELFGKTMSGDTINQIIPSFATSDDNLAPIIKQVKTDAALSLGKEIKVQAIISWYTNEPSTSRVYYEQGAGRADEDLTQASPIDENFARHHVVVVTNFNPGSIYRFQVESIDGEGNASRSRTYTILTPKQQESVFQVIMKNVETTFGWLEAFR